MPHPKGQPQPVKIWNDWSDGIGFTIDDGRSRGMHYASGLLGLKNELRVAPFFNTIDPNIDTVAMNWVIGGTSVLAAYAACSVRPSVGSVTLLSNTNYVNAVAATSFSFSHTVGVGTDMLLVSIANAGTIATDAPTVTWDGPGAGGPVALTQVAYADSSSDASIYRLVSPELGAGTITVTFVNTYTVVITAYNLDNVDTGSPIVDSETAVRSTTARGIIGADLDSVSGAMSFDVLSAIDAANLTITANPRQATVHAPAPQSTLLAGHSRTASGIDIDPFHAVRMFEAPVEGDYAKAYLYLQTQKLVSHHALTRLYKVSLKTSNFATVQSGFRYMSHNTKKGAGLSPGQAARYQQDWFVPVGGGSGAQKLDVVADGAIGSDTWAITGTVGGEHLAAFGAQLASYSSEVAAGAGIYGGGSSGQDGGVRILKVDGNPHTDGDWGAAFPAGDKTERALGLSVLENSTYVLKHDGLYSFTLAGRAGYILEDLGAWLNMFANAPVKAWHGGLFLTHPSGLLFFVPRNLPVYAGPEARVGAPITPAGASEFFGGIYHSVDTAGDYVYVIYQPRRTSTDALVMCGYGPPDSLSWQGLGTITLADTNMFADIFVSKFGRPIDEDYVTPSVWFSNAANLNYIVLNHDASPFRPRSDTHRVQTSGDAYMSELIFSPPIDITQVTAYTRDMAAGDEWQLSFLMNGNSTDLAIPAPLRGNGRHERKLQLKDVHRLTLHVGWAATSTAARVPPSLAHIELYGEVH